MTAAGLAGAYPFITHPAVDLPGFVYGFGVKTPDMPLSARTAGEDDPGDHAWHAELRRWYADRLMAAYPLRAVAGVRQVHGSRVVFVTDPERDWSLVEADVVITAEIGVAVTVQTADCLPALVFSRQPPAVAAVHAGWRGTLDSALHAAIAALHNRLAIPPRDLIVVLGPCIGPSHYHVDAELAERFKTAFGPAAVRRHASGAPTLDLVEANRRIACNAGVPADRIFSIGACAFSEETRFFSHRRDQGHSGRQRNFAAILDLDAARGPLPLLDLCDPEV